MTRKLTRLSKTEKLSKDSQRLSTTERLSMTERLLKTLNDWKTLKDSQRLTKTLKDSQRLTKTLKDPQRLSKTLKDSQSYSKTLNDSQSYSKTLKERGKVILKAATTSSSYATWSLKTSCRVDTKKQNILNILFEFVRGLCPLCYFFYASIKCAHQIHFKHEGQQTECHNWEMRI